MPRVIAYTDGAANNALPLDQRPGGWAVVMMLLTDEGTPDPRAGAYKEISGGVPSATNNQMELEAVRQTLLALHHVNFEKVKGHAGQIHNERADELAVMERKKREG